MKTKEEMLDDYGCPEIPFDENVTMFYPAILSAMQEYAESYHSEQLSAGIKAKALRKKGTDEWYYYVGFMNDWRAKNDQLLQSLDSATINPKYYPSDAELVNIIILEDKP